MPLFTFVLDFAGGTSIAQAEAVDEHQALLRWADQLDSDTVAWVGAVSLAAVKRDLLDGEGGSLCVSVSGLQNVWCYALEVRGGLFLVHWVRTEPAAPRA